MAAPQRYRRVGDRWQLFSDNNPCETFDRIAVLFTDQGRVVTVHKFGHPDEVACKAQEIRKGLVEEGDSHTLSQMGVLELGVEDISEDELNAVCCNGRKLRAFLDRHGARMAHLATEPRLEIEGT